MANTSNAANFILNIVELQNTITNAGGTTATATLSNTVSQLAQMVNFNQKQIKADVISRYSVSPITVTDSLNLSNATLFVNGTAATGLGGASTITAGPSKLVLTSTVGATTAAAAFTVGSPATTPFQILGGGALQFPTAGTPTVGYYLTCMDASGTAEWQPAALPSDAQLKRNVRTLEGAGDMIAGLRGVRFDWSASGKGDIGLIAQEVAGVVPEAIGKLGDYMTVNYYTMVPILIESIKSLQTRVSTLEGLRS
jgi:hypothetical protein